MAIYNAKILHEQGANKKIPFATFQLDLIKEIITKYNVPKDPRRGRRSAEEIPTRLTGRHFIEKISQEEKILRSCVVCGKRKLRKRTAYMCQDCDAALCVENCFKIYHTVQNY